MTEVTPSTSYSFTPRLRIRDRSGMRARVLHTIARLQGDPGAVVFLASDRARYITGEILDVNGGFVMD